MDLTFQDFFFPHSLSSVENSWEPVSPLCQSFRSFYLPRFPHRNPTALHAFPLLELPATPMSQSDLSTCCWMCFMSSGALASGCPVPSTKHSPARPSTLLDTESSPLRSLKMYLVTGSHGLLWFILFSKQQEVSQALVKFSILAVSSSAIKNFYIHTDRFTYTNVYVLLIY